MKTTLNTLLGFFFSDTAGTFKTNEVPATVLTDGSITSTQLGAKSVTTAKIDDGAVGTTQIADASVTNAKLSLDDGGLPIAKIDPTSLLQYQNPILNGSFEAVTSTVPDRWTLTTFTGGTAASDTDSSHGGKSIKFTETSGNGNGGGTATSNYFFEVSDKKPVFLTWLHKCDTSGMHNKVEVLWFDASQVALGTASTTIYDTTASPTTWTEKHSVTAPPSGAKYAKIKLTGGHNDTNPTGTHNAWFDEVQFIAPQFDVRMVFDTPGTYKWIAPGGRYAARVTCVGAGGGGGGGGSNGIGGGGGAGGTAISYVSITPGTVYTIVVGTGGLGQPSVNNGASGTSSTFNSTVVVGNAGAFGSGDTAGAGAGGAGGSGTGFLVIAGGSGVSRGGTPAGYGGSGSGGGASNALNGLPPGGGGGGGLTGNNPSGAGANGRVIIEF